jgi:hypothetical protein
MSANSMMRAFFLTLIFPHIISRGRKWYTTTSLPPPPEANTSIPIHAEDLEPPQVVEGEEPDPAPAPTTKAYGSKFDLVFVRWSMALDGILTAIVIFADKGWHMYLGSSSDP